jgi:hypothetical protein
MGLTGTEESSRKFEEERPWLPTYPGFCPTEPHASASMGSSKEASYNFLRVGEGCE